MGRTLSLLVALVCLSAPELAHQIAGDARLMENGGRTLTPGGRMSLERNRVSIRSLPDCLKVARRSSARALYHALYRSLYQGATAESGIATGSPLVEMAYFPSSPRGTPPAASRTFSLFERPPPAV